jgi:hypothetical protein
VADAKGDDSSESEDSYHSSESEQEADADAGGEDAGSVTLPVLLHCTAKRSSLLKYSDEPFFNKMMTGCFVRVLAGKPPDRRYSIAQVRRMSKSCFIRLLCPARSTASSFCVHWL